MEIGLFILMYLLLFITIAHGIYSFISSIRVDREFQKAIKEHDRLSKELTARIEDKSDNE